MDTKTLAQNLGLTEKTIRSRAAALGLTADQVKQGPGRPKAMWSPEQAEAISNYGKQADSAPTEDLDDVEGTAAAAGYPYGSKEAAINMFLEEYPEAKAIIDSMPNGNDVLGAMMDKTVKKYFPQPKH